MVEQISRLLFDLFIRQTKSQTKLVFIGVQKYPLYVLKRLIPHLPPPQVLPSPRAPVGQARLTVRPVVVRALRHPPLALQSWLESHWRLIELLPEQPNQLPDHPGRLAIVQERPNPGMVLPLLVTRASLPPLLCHLHLPTTCLKVVPELNIISQKG